MSAETHKSPIDSRHSAACFKLFPDPLPQTQRYALAGLYHEIVSARRPLLAPPWMLAHVRKGRHAPDGRVLGFSTGERQRCQASSWRVSAVVPAVSLTLRETGCYILWASKHNRPERVGAKRFRRDC